MVDFGWKDGEGIGKPTIFGITECTTKPLWRYHEGYHNGSSQALFEAAADSIWDKADLGE